MGLDKVDKRILAAARTLPAPFTAAQVAAKANLDEAQAPLTEDKCHQRLMQFGRENIANAPTFTLTTNGETVDIS